MDIDAQAVEVTKLSLLLKVLEGESEQTLATQLRMFQERALPDLDNNIKWGNSLISPDIYDEEQITLLDEEAHYQINVFDWNEAFPQIMDSGGFDAVIGNPPYGASASSIQISYYRNHYTGLPSTNDSFVLFLEKSSSLIRAGGIFGMIIPSGWVSSPSMAPSRNLFSSRFRPVAFASMPYDVFDAYIDTVITIAERAATGRALLDLPRSNVLLHVFPARFKIRSVDDFALYEKTADAVQWLQEENNEFVVTLSEEEYKIARKVRAIGGKFSDVADIQRGVTPFHLSSEKPPINGFPAFDGTVRRYKIEDSHSKFIRYDETLAEYKPPRYFQGPRLLLRELISRQFQLQAVFTETDFITNKSMQTLLLKNEDYQILYLLGLLNSKLISWYFLALHSVGRRDDFPKVVLKQTRELPFRKIDFSNSSDVRRHDRVVELVERILALHKQLVVAQISQEKTIIQRQIEATDRQIDQLVYELYGLTEEETKLVEEAIR